MSKKQGSAPPSWRSAAEAELARMPEAAGQGSKRSAEELLHELQVHQIELEMQNETLRQARIELEASRDRYLDLYEFAPVGYLTLDRDGRIASINLTGATLFGEDRARLGARPFTHFVTADDQDSWHRHWRRVLQDDAKLTCELRLQRRDGSIFAACLDCLRTVDGGVPSGVRITLSDISARWAAEKALHESETRFRALADAAPALIWLASADRQRTWFNRQWLEFTGQAIDGSLGAGWTALVHADDRGRYLEIHDDAFARRVGFEAEYRLRRADGDYRWVIDRGLPRFSDNGEFLGYVGTCVDVTRIKRAEEELIRAQGVGHIGSWRFDVPTQQLRWSRETYRIFGIPEDMPVSYATFLAQVHPEDTWYVDQVWRACTPSKPYDIEHRLLVDGAVRWVHSWAEFEFDEHGQPCVGFGIVQDITELTLARQAELESRERFDAFMTHSSVPAWVVDASGRFHYASPTFYRTFRLPFADIVGKRLDELFPPALAAGYLLGGQASLSSAEPVESVETAARADGSSGEFLVVRFPIHDPRGRVLIGGMAIDVTERRQTVAQLEAAKLRLERLTIEQAVHLRAVAGELTRAEQRERDRLYERLHDEIQPLLVAARLSLSGMSPRTTLPYSLQAAAEACEHIGQAIDLARTLSLQLSPPLLRERGLGAALEWLATWVRDKHGVVVDLNCEPDAEADDMGLRLLCFNSIRELLLNVAKHAGGANATLDLQRVDGDALRITVADRGVGFDPAAAVVGSGLAAIARRLAMFGGSLEVDSRPGGGTVATVTVPLVQATADGGASDRHERRKAK